MVLDIDRFRDEKSGKGSVESIKENQRKRFKDEKLVDEVTAADEGWRKGKSVILLSVKYGCKLVTIGIANAKSITI